jgi:2-octaprenyl-6-methoxyphenol hydroxylase
MRDVDALLRLLSDPAVDPGQAGLLAQFVRNRQADQSQIVRFTDTLARGFRGRAALPAHARSAALLGLDTLAPLRTRFARRTMGLVN